MIQLLEQKRPEVRHTVLNAHLSVMRVGFVDTTKASVLSSNKALEIACAKVHKDAKKREADCIASLRRSRRQAVLKERHKCERASVSREITARRATLAGIPVDAFVAQVRSLRERRVVVRIRVMEKRIRERYDPKDVTQQLCLLADKSGLQ